MTDAPGYAIATFITDPDTGERLSIEHDDEYSTLIGEYHENYCKHPDHGTYRFKVSNGAVQVSKCCSVCGQRSGTALSQRDKAWVSSLPWLPDGMSADYRQERESHKRSLLVELARRQSARRGAHTESYKKYIASPEWSTKRALVMKRCGGTCEGCGTKPATEVHHHHYDHLFNEFLFELVGLCHGCHERITQERRDHQEAAAQEWQTRFGQHSS